MRTVQSVFWVLLVALGAALNGCASKGQATPEARAAFAAGQQQATAQMLQRQNQGPIVTVIGDVRNPIIPWAEDLTLAKAIVAANYYGNGDPKDIVIVRNGRGIPVDPRKLLSGEDVPLLEHDVVAIRH